MQDYLFMQIVCLLCLDFFEESIDWGLLRCYRVPLYQIIVIKLKNKSGLSKLKQDFALSFFEFIEK